MTNCKNCGAPIDIYTDKCPWCGTPYEALSGSRSGELNGDIELREKLEKEIGSEWDFDDDFEERAARYSRREKLEPKWVLDSFDIS